MPNPLAITTRPSFQAAVLLNEPRVLQQPGSARTKQRQHFQMKHTAVHARRPWHQGDAMPGQLRTKPAPRMIVSYDAVDGVAFERLGDLCRRLRSVERRRDFDQTILDRDIAFLVADRAGKRAAELHRPAHS
jgi:hypothetical protein